MNDSAAKSRRVVPALVVGLIVVLVGAVLGIVAAAGGFSDDASATSTRTAQTVVATGSLPGKYGLRLGRMAVPPLPPDEVPDALSQAFPAGTAVQAFVLSEVETAQVMTAVGANGDLATFVDTGDGVEHGVLGTSATFLVEQLAKNGGVHFLGSDTDASQNVTFAVFIVADGFVDVTLAGETTPIDGNAFVFTGRAPIDTVAEFHGPGGAVKVPLIPS